MNSESHPTRVAIIGAGMLGTTLVQHVATNPTHSLACFFDDTMAVGTEVRGVRVAGDVGAVEAAFAANEFDALLIGIGYRHLAVRQALYERFAAAGIPFATLIHPSAYVDSSASVGAGSILFPGCVLGDRARVGVNSLLNLSCMLAHDAYVGNHAFLSVSVNLAGYTRVEDRCFVGIGTTIIDRVSIGPDCQTGAGAVVVRSLDEPGQLLVGVPARPRLRSDPS